MLQFGFIGRGVGGVDAKPSILYLGKTLPSVDDYMTDGVELVVNGGFDTDSDWVTINGNWSISDGVVTNDGITNDWDLKQDLDLDGSMYKITFEVIYNTSGTVQLYDSLENKSSQIYSSGVFTLYVNMTGFISFYPRNLFDGSIDNVSVQKVIQQPDHRYLKNEGKNKQNLPLTYGNPLDFQGTQYIAINKAISLSGDTLSATMAFTLSDIASIKDLIVFDTLKIYTDNATLKVDINATTYTVATMTSTSYYALIVEVDDGRLSVTINDIKVYDELCETLNISTLDYVMGNTNLFDGQADYVMVYDGVIVPNTDPETFYEDMVGDANTIFATDFRGNNGYISDSMNYHEVLRLDENFNDLTNFTGNFNANPVIVDPRDGFTTTFVNITKGGDSDIGVIWSDYEVGTGKLFKVRFKYRTNGNYCSIACGGNNDEILPINEGAAIEYTYIAQSGNGLNVYLVAKYDAYLEVDELEVSELTAVYPITNYSATMRTNFDDSPTGLQDNFRTFDNLGFWIGNKLNYGLVGQVPALNLDLTDSELNSGDGFVISVVIDRDILATDAYLLDTLSSLTGLTLNLNKNGDEVELLLFDGASSAGVSTVIDEDLNGIIFEATSTNVTLVVDGVAGTSVAHSFVPSGLNFKDSTTASPIGELPYFALWYGDDYKRYDREKEIIAHNIAINEYYALFSIEGDDILVTEDGYALAYLN